MRGGLRVKKALTSWKLKGAKEVKEIKLLDGKNKADWKKK